MIWRDDSGSELDISGWSGDARLTISDETGKAAVLINAGDVPAVARRMWQACGLVPPVMLPRPEIPPDGAFRLDAGLLAEAEDGTVSVRLGPHGASLSPAQARRLAGALAVLADQAGAGPDPEGVEALAEVIARADRESDSVADASELARAILRAGYRREARNGE